jgi:hypothetical protein
LEGNALFSSYLKWKVFGLEFYEYGTCFAYVQIGEEREIEMGHHLRDNLKLNHGGEEFEKPCSFWTLGGQDMKWPMTILEDM